MSTLHTNNLAKQSGVGVPDFNGVAANRLLPSAWVNFNGTGVVAIRDAHNVASITDDGVGLYTANFTSLMASANYSAITAVQRVATNNGIQSCIKQGSAPTTASIGVASISLSGALEDPLIFNIAIFGGF